MPGGASARHGQLARPAEAAKGLGLGGQAAVSPGGDYHTDIDRTLKEDVVRLRDVKTLPEGVTVSGYVYDVRTGTLREVEPA